MPIYPLALNQGLVCLAMAGTLLCSPSLAAQDRYAINLQSTLAADAIEHVPVLDAFRDKRLYTTPFVKEGKVFHRVRLGFFTDRAAASDVLRELSAQFPGAWLARVSDSEYDLALIHTTPEADRPAAQEPPRQLRPARTPADEVPVLLASAEGTKAATPDTDPASRSNGSSAFDFDAPPPTRIRLLPDLSFGAKVELEGELERDFDLDSDRDDDLRTLSPTLSLAFSYTPTEDLQAYLNIEPSQQFVDDDRNRKDNETRLQVKQAFLAYSGLFDGSTIKLGRQRFQDEREWLYDDELDGVRLFHTFSRFAVEFSVSTRNDQDLLQNQSVDDVTNYVIHGHYAPDKDTAIGLYAIAQNDRENKGDEEDDRTLFGVHASGEFRDQLEYWLELGYLRGELGSDDIRAWAFDVGSTYVFDTHWEPSITLGYAIGSGDDDPGSGTDKNFRQTGFQDNSAKYNGLIRLKYYGEMVDPELSNLKVATVGLGLRPTRRTSLDLVYHNLRQHQASEEIRDWEIDEDPNGRSTDIGNEIDFIAGFRFKPHFKSSLILGRFYPGDAFPDDADDATYAELELEYLF